MATIAQFTLVEVRPDNNYLVDIRVTGATAAQLGWGAKRVDRQVFHLEGDTAAELKASLRDQVKAFFQETRDKYQASLAVAPPPSDIVALVGVETNLDDA